VNTSEYAAVAAVHSVDPDRWWTEFSAVIDRIAPRFCRYEPLRHAAELMAGMVSGLDRKNCWTIAEHRGAATPDGLQHLLSRAKWDADAVRDDLRDYVIDAFGDPQAILVLDETGDVKKGVYSVGVQRQYTGTAGRIENAQVAVYLTYAAPRGHALIDRALYLPRSWAEDPHRCDDAGIPTDKRDFATKPTLAAALVARTVAANVPAAWVAGDEVYGADPRLRAAVRDHGLGYVLAVSANRRVPTAAGPIRVDRLPAELPSWAWQKHSAGAGSHGPRYHSWAWIPALLLTAPDHPAHPGHRGRSALAYRGILPNRQRTHRTGPAPGEALDLLAPLDHPGHARPRLPGRGHRHRTRHPTHTGRANRVDRQRIPSTLRRPAARHPPHHHHTAGLVTMATTTPIPSPSIPLPTTPAPMITNYGCSTNRPQCVRSRFNNGSN